MRIIEHREPPRDGRDEPTRRRRTAAVVAGLVAPPLTPYRTGGVLRPLQLSTIDLYPYFD